MRKPQPANGEMGRDERIHIVCATPVLAFVVAYFFQYYERGAGLSVHENLRTQSIYSCVTWLHQVVEIKGLQSHSSHARSTLSYFQSTTGSIG